jgi:hypothetical protein
MLSHTEKVKTFLNLREARGRLCRYMTSIGYTVIGTDSDILFERGNAFGRIPGSPPRTSPVRVFAHIGKAHNGSEVILRWEMGGAFKMLSIWDVNYFRKEVQGAIKTISARNVNMNDLELTHTSSAVMTLAMYVAVLLTVTVMFVLMAAGDVSLGLWLLVLIILGALLLATRAPLTPSKRTSG